MGEGRLQLTVLSGSCHDGRDRSFAAARKTNRQSAIRRSSRDQELIKPIRARG